MRLLLKYGIRGPAGEAMGTAFLLAAVVGSGIMAERLCGGNLGVALLANALATGGVLIALIACLAPVSGAHFNPIVTLDLAMEDSFPWAWVPAYVVSQCVVAFAGIRPAEAPAFIAVQLVTGILGSFFLRWLMPMPIPLSSSLPALHPQPVPPEHV